MVISASHAIISTEVNVFIATTAIVKAAKQAIF